MNPRQIAFCLLPLALAACAFGYQARGELAGIGEMRGKAYPGSTQAGGRFLLADPAGRVQCEGEVWGTTPPAQADSCQGQGGEGRVRCSDGRVIPVRWQALSCRSWQGEGVDAGGQALSFRVERR